MSIWSTKPKLSLQVKYENRSSSSFILYVRYVCDKGNKPVDKIFIKLHNIFYFNKKRDKIMDDL